MAKPENNLLFFAILCMSLLSKFPPTTKFTVHTCIILYNCSDEGFPPKKNTRDWPLGRFGRTTSSWQPRVAETHRRFRLKKDPRMPWTLQLLEVVPPRSQPKPMAHPLGSTGALGFQNTKNNGKMLGWGPHLLHLDLGSLWCWCRSAWSCWSLRSWSFWSRFQLHQLKVLIFGHLSW